MNFGRLTVRKGACPAAFSCEMKEQTNPSEEAWRVFCAIELPRDLRKRLTTHIKHLRDAVPQAHASWSQPDNIHLTLKFIGEIPQTRVENLLQAASRAVEDAAPFKIVIERTGVFPPHGPPRVLWIGINDSSGKLTELQGRLEDECAKEGFPKETRPFHPHLTIARLRKPQGARTLAATHKELDFEPIEVNVNELLVMRSELSSEGSKYTVLSSHPLGAPESRPQ